MTLKSEKAVSVENRIIAAFRKGMPEEENRGTDWKVSQVKEWLDLPEELVKSERRKGKTERGKPCKGRQSVISYKKWINITVTNIKMLKVIKFFSICGKWFMKCPAVVYD